MMLVLLAYAKGEYGTPGLESAHHGLRRDLSRLGATAFDLKSLSADDPALTAAWRAYEPDLVADADIAKAKEVAKDTAGSIDTWRKYGRPGENDMWQAGVFIPPLGLAMLQADVKRLTPAEQAEQDWRDANMGPGSESSSSSSNQSGASSSGENSSVTVSGPDEEVQQKREPVDYCADVRPTGCMQVCIGFSGCSCANRCQHLGWDLEHAREYTACQRQCGVEGEELFKSCDRRCNPPPPPCPHPRGCKQAVP